MASIMIQGTMSGVGKSLLTAALCRILSDDGYKVAPFKSQNMALNSYVTPDGFEIGRAQALQAAACRCEPSVLHNPILLKPTADHVSQVILHGEVLSDMTARDYFKKRREFMPEIMASFERLSRENDVVVIEGAGSPVELNLNRDDIVNMGLAKETGSPVVLVGDIDPGGIFAQILGTLDLLEENRHRVKALIVNKFRGDRRLFDDGVKILEERGKVPVAGVIPYYRNTLDEEDSLTSRFSARNDAPVKIAVIHLPHISNFTDVDVFREYDEADVFFAHKPEDLENADMIIIPGSKSVISDMEYLERFGNMIRKKSADTLVFGICGGYEMMGDVISDPDNCEGGGECKGLSLLPVNTVITDKKERRQIKGTVTDGILKDAAYSGYEIHMGHTTGGTAFTDHNNSAFKGNVYGTFIHGFFDEQGISGSIMKMLCERKGIPFSGTKNSRSAQVESELSELADIVRNNMDMELIRKVAGL